MFWTFFDHSIWAIFHSGTFGSSDWTPKIQPIQIELIWANPEILLFWRMRFFNFFFNHMSQKYQNEKSPILNGQKKSKTSEKVQKMRDLEGPTSFRPFENTRYYYFLFLVLGELQSPESRDPIFMKITQATTTTVTTPTLLLSYLLCVWIWICLHRGLHYKYNVLFTYLEAIWNVWLASARAGGRGPTVAPSVGDFSSILARSYICIASPPHTQPPVQLGPLIARVVHLL